MSDNKYLGDQVERVKWEPDITPGVLECNIIKSIWRTQRFRVATYILREYVKLKINGAVARKDAALKAAEEFIDNFIASRKTIAPGLEKTEGAEPNLKEARDARALIAAALTEGEPR